jgi:putative transcriptional regulator
MISTVIKINLAEQLKEKNKSIYRLQQETGITYPTLLRISKGNVQSISLDVLEKICVNLECSPSDLLQIVPGNKPTKSKV